MPREIKFRGISNVDNKTMVYGFYAQKTVDYNLVHGSPRLGTKTEHVLINVWHEPALQKGYAMVTERETSSPIIPETLSQFTGLFDCSGVEIWENDIVEREDGKRSFVVFDEGAFRTEWGGANSLTKGILMNMHIPGIKVVGNRFNGIEAQELAP